MPALDGTFPFRAGQVSSTRPFPQTNHRHHHHHHLGNTRVPANIACDISSSLRLVSFDPACLSLSVIFAQFATVTLPRKCQLLRRAGRKRAGKQVRTEQQRAQGCARPAPGHCLILGWRRMPFLPQTLNINQNRTVPHRIARHRTVPHLVLPSGPSTGRPVSLLLRATASSSGALSSISQRLT